MVLREDPRRVQYLGAGGDGSGVSEVDVGRRLDRERDVVQAGRVQLERLLLERLPQAERARARGREAQVVDRLAALASSKSTAPRGRAARRPPRRTRATARGRGRRGRRARARRSLRISHRLGEQRRHVDDAQLLPVARTPSSSITVQNGQATASVSAPVSAASRTRSSLIAPAALLHPHVRAAGAAAERPLAAARHLDRLADGGDQLARRGEHVVVAGQVAGVVVGDRARRPPRREPAVAHELGEQLGVVDDLVAAAEVRVLVRRAC